MNETAILEIAKADAYATAIIGNWVITLIAIIGLTYLLKDKKANMGDFWKKMTAVIIITGILTLFTVIAPEWVNTLVTWIQNI